MRGGSALKENMGLFPKILIDDALVGEMERAGGVELKLRHRAKLGELLETLGVSRWFDTVARTPQLKKDLRARVKYLAGLRQCLDFRVEFSDPRADCNELIAFYDGLMEIAGFESESLFLGLGTLQNCSALLVPSGHRSIRSFAPFLSDLETLYRDAGGGSTGVSNNNARDERESRFIEFIWPAVRLLPDDWRPSSSQALASVWQRIFQDRDRYLTRSRVEYFSLMKSLTKSAPWLSPSERRQKQMDAGAFLLDEEWLEMRPTAPISWWGDLCAESP
jgi:hypothetical protein